ncbi:MAG TPA: hypothetical protein PLU88_13820, partial [Armatimonadota bacterium]|nr:hypothetical protein [Armatimonadota bacterium]
MIRLNDKGVVWWIIPLVIGAALAVSAVIYALVLLTVMTGEIHEMSTSVQSLPKLNQQLDAVTERLAGLEETNRRLAQVETKLTTLEVLPEVNDK